MPEELTRVTRYRAPDPIVDDPTSAETVKPYTSVKCAKEAKEVIKILLILLIIIKGIDLYVLSHILGYLNMVQWMM